MKTKMILAGLFALAGIHAQSAGWNWAVGLGGSGSETGSAVVVDAATNILVTG